MTETASVEPIFCAMLIRRADDLARETFDDDTYRELQDALAQNRVRWRVRAFGGGRVMFVRENIDYTVYIALMTMNEKHSDSPNPAFLLEDKHFL